jgi:uncharacterized membrane protein HdeD (DUF308 family)
MQNAGTSVPPEAARADFAQFGRRELDKLSWLAPLINHRLGELLRLQLRHEHLFFFKNGEVVAEIGYGEDGRRFSERDKGKPMRTPEDVKAQGYWLISPRIPAQAAFEALGDVKDGAYYSVFSNQCQDWAYRVRRRALAIQKAQNLALPDPAESAAEVAGLDRRVPPTVPAAWYFSMIAIIVGILGLAAPAAAGFHYLQFVALLLVGVGVSDVIYAFASRVWGTFLYTLLTGLSAIASGALLWLNSAFVFANSNGVLALVLAAGGLARVAIALMSRPFSAWVGTLVTGLLLLVSAGVAWQHRDGAAAAWMLGAALSISFISEGVSTIWLNWRLDNSA